MLKRIPNMNDVTTCGDIGSKKKHNLEIRYSTIGKCVYQCEQCYDCNYSTATLVEVKKDG